MKPLPLMFTALMLPACGAPADGGALPSAPQADRSAGASTIAIRNQGARGMDQGWAKGGCDQPEPVGAYAGKTIDAATASLGAPADEQRFTLGAGMNEFRIELRNDLPLPANADLPVLERSWSKGECRLTLWSVQRDGAWHVVRAMRWPAGAEF